MCLILSHRARRWLTWVGLSGQGWSRLGGDAAPPSISCMKMDKATSTGTEELGHLGPLRHFTKPKFDFLSLIMTLRICCYN